MSKAPLSQTLFLTEDGSIIPVTTANAVVIPPVVAAAIANTLASSILIAGIVLGMTALFEAQDARAAANMDRRTAQRTRRLALTTRIAQLEL